MFVGVSETKGLVVSLRGTGTAVVQSKTEQLELIDLTRFDSLVAYSNEGKTTVSTRVVVARVRTVCVLSISTILFSIVPRHNSSTSSRVCNFSTNISVTYLYLLEGRRGKSSSVSLSLLSCYPELATYVLRFLQPSTNVYKNWYLGRMTTTMTWTEWCTVQIKYKNDYYTYYLISLHTYIQFYFTIQK